MQVLCGDSVGLGHDIRQEEVVDVCKAREYYMKVAGVPLGPGDRKGA